MVDYDNPLGVVPYPEMTSTDASGLYKRSYEVAPGGITQKPKEMTLDRAVDMIASLSATVAKLSRQLDTLERKVDLVKDKAFAEDKPQELRKFVVSLPVDFEIIASDEDDALEIFLEAIKSDAHDFFRVKPKV